MKRAALNLLTALALGAASGCAVFICSPGSQMTTALPLTGVNNHGTASQPVMPGASSNGVSAGSESTGGLGGGGSGGGGGGSVTTPAAAATPTATNTSSVVGK